MLEISFDVRVMLFGTQGWHKELNEFGSYQPLIWEFFCERFYRNRRPVGQGLQTLPILDEKGLAATTRVRSWALLNKSNLDKATHF